MAVVPGVAPSPAVPSGFVRCMSGLVPEALWWDELNSRPSGAGAAGGQLCSDEGGLPQPYVGGWIPQRCDDPCGFWVYRGRLLALSCGFVPSPLCCASWLGGLMLYPPCSGVAGVGLGLPPAHVLCPQCYRCVLRPKVVVVTVWC